MLFFELGPGYVEGNSGEAGDAAHLCAQRLVLGLGPGLNCAFGQGLRGVRNDQVHIEVDGVAEALATRAGTVGIVEGE